MPELDSKKQERFCLEYIVDYNATQAAIRAGYKEKNAGTTAHKILKNPKVLARVRELQAEQAERLSISADWVILQLVEIHSRCMQHSPVMEWDSESHSYQETGEYQFNSKGALGALEMIGKHMGMWNGTGNTAPGKAQELSNLFEALEGSGKE